MRAGLRIDKALRAKIDVALGAKGFSVEAAAKRIGTTRQSLSNWLSGKHSFPETAVLPFCNLLGLKETDFYRHGPGVSPADESDTWRPFIEWGDLKRVVGGKVQMLMSSKAKKFPVRQGLPGDSIVLKVDDASMEPEFHEGETFVVSPSGYPQDRCFVVARLPDGTHILRRYLSRRGKAFDLQPENADWKTLSSTAEHPIEIIGVVVEHHRRNFG